MKVKYLLFDDSFSSPEKHWFKISQNLTEFYATLNLPKELIVWQNFDWWEIDCDYLVILSAGQLIKSPNHHEEVLKHLDQDFLVMCHLMKYGNYYGFDRQWACINMNKLKELGIRYASLPSDGKVRVRNAERSPDNIHDDYTPLWLKPAKGYSEETCYMIGWNIISASLDAGLPVLNVPDSIRQTKTHLYPYAENEFLRLIKGVEKSATYDRMSVFYWSTDSIPVVDEHYDNVFTVAAGTIPFHLTAQATPSNLFYFDYSADSLKWHKSLWDTKQTDYKQLVEKSEFLGQTKQGTEEHIEPILAAAYDVQPCVDYIYTDILAENIVIDKIKNQTGKTLINISNCFCTLGSYWYAGKHGAWKYFKYFISQLPDDVVVLGTTPELEYINQISAKELKSKYRA
jgi:hypothetical protein